MTSPIPRSPPRHRAPALLLCLLAVSAGVAYGDSEALDPLDPLLQPARAVPHAESAVLIAVARAGDRLVAAGESGIVLTSDDGGRRWHQTEVPVRVTLTAVYFPTPERGWAVGHSGVVLTSADAGATWTRQLDGRQIAGLPVEPAAAPPADAADAVPPSEPSPGDPLLDVLFLDEREGYAVGAFGLLLHTVDGGEHWRRASARLPNPDGNHLYGIARSGDRLYIAGERGAVFVSDDRGAHFRAVETPYQGSFFGVAAQQDQVVVFGLEGHAYAAATGADADWRALGTGGSAWTAAAALDDGRLALVGQSGTVAIAPAHGELVRLPVEAPPVSDVAPGTGGDLVTVGPRGVHVVAAADASIGSAAR